MQKTLYLVQQITSNILKSNQRSDTSHVFGITDLVKFIIVGSDLHKHVEKNMRNLASLIDLGYAKFSVSEELQAKIAKMIEERDKNTYEIKHITCASSHAFAFFLIAAGFDNNRVLR